MEEKNEVVDKVNQPAAITSIEAKPDVNHAIDHQPSVEYATFGSRAVAAIIDFFILGIIGYFLNRVIFSLTFLQHQSGYLSQSLLPFVVGILYFGYMESSVSQATYGKQAMGIKVSDLGGKRISVARAALRYVGKYASSFIFFIGYIFMFFTEKKQALHDLIASTVVVKK